MSEENPPTAARHGHIRLRRAADLQRLRGTRNLQPALLILAVALPLALAGGWLAWAYGLKTLDRQLADRLSFSSHVLAAEMDRLGHLPRVLAQDLRLQAALEQPDEAALVLRANQSLQLLRNLTDADEAYLIGSDGITIAASNWNEPGSYIGMNYGFRPYFRDAMLQGEASYYAIGVTTGKPGAFLSARFEAPPIPAGLAVVKMDLSPIEATWARAGEITMVTDEDGMVFLSSASPWRFRPLTSLSPDARARLADEQRYAGIDLSSVPPLPVEGRWFLPESGERLRILQGRVPGRDWHMLVALPLAPVLTNAMLFAGLAGAGGALGAFGLVILRQRRQILRLRLIEADRLERAVRQRTSELAQEVEERRRTEETLRRTQEGLVHAAKLAVLGRMSSAIVHEVGQSLSALDNNLAAAELHASRTSGTAERLPEALHRARQMLRRLQGVVVRLRNFGSRQSLVALSPVDPRPALTMAAEIVMPRARELGVTIRLPSGELPWLRADGPRLEQVLSNLLLNAVEACAASPAEARLVTVEVRALSPAQAEIRVSDSGSGFAPEVIGQAGQPFVTHGKGAAGFGLGLYIVQNLLEQLEGSIRFGENPLGKGAMVTLRFGAAPAAKNEGQSA